MMTTTQPGAANEGPMTAVAAFQDLARRIMYIHDPDNVSAFLLSYRSFEAIGADLCAIWIDEFVKVCEKEKADEFRRAVKKKISERMLDFLEIWVNKYNPNFSAKETERLLEVLKERTSGDTLNKFKLSLLKFSEPHSSKEKKEKKGEAGRMASSNSGLKTAAPRSPGLDESGDQPTARLVEYKPTAIELENFKFDLLDEHPPSLIAKQLTLYEWDIFKEVKPEEFLNQNWAKGNKLDVAPNINRLIEQFNKVSYWVAVEILTADGVRYQTKVLRKFISMAFNCIEYHNYNTALALLAGLNHSSIQRLKNIWEKLPDREEELYRQMDSLMQPRNNFRNYRKDLSSKALPAFPQISLICRDFTYIYDGNPKYNPDGSINFDLPMLVYERVKEIEKYQSLAYDFPRNPKILGYFPYLAKYGNLDEDYLHDLSLRAQPSMWNATTTLQESEDTGSENTPNDENSDSASSESGSSRYIKKHARETRTADVDPMHPPGGLDSPHSKKKNSDSPSTPQRRKTTHGSRGGNDSSSNTNTNTEDDDSSFGSMSESMSSPKPKKTKKQPKRMGEGSEDSYSPRTPPPKDKPSPGVPKRPRRKDSSSLGSVSSTASGEKSGCHAVKVPSQYTQTFSQAETLVERFFSQVAQSVSRGTLTIGNKRYLLIRARSLSVDFNASIRKTFDFSSKVKGEEFFRKLLFNFGQLIAKSDVKTLARTVNLKTPLQIFAAGSIYQAYAGLGFVEIPIDHCECLANQANPSTYSLVTNYRVSCEAESWKAASKMFSHPCCPLLNGYVSGWASGAYGIPLVGTEVLCVTKGDAICRTFLCSPDKAKSMVKNYMATQSFDEELRSKVKVPTLLTAEDAELYENARKDMNEKQKKTLFEKSKKLLTSVSKVNKEELDAKEKKLLALERKSLHYFSTVYAERRYNPKEGKVLVGDEPYVFIRGKAISKGFVELILQMFPPESKGRALSFAFDFLFDLAHSIGKSDYKHCIEKLGERGRENLHPLKKIMGLKKAFSHLGWGSVKYDFRTANLVYSGDNFFFCFTLDNSFESSIWMKAKQKMKEEEEARREVEEAAADLAKQKGMTLEEAFRKLEKANKSTTTHRKKTKATGEKEDGGEASSSPSSLGGGDDEFNFTAEVVKSPVCVMCAGFANGYIRKCFKNKEAKDRDLDLVVVEVLCRAAGHQACEFLVCSKNQVLTSVKTYLKEKNESLFLPNVKYYNVLRKKKK